MKFLTPTLIGSSMAMMLITSCNTTQSLKTDIKEVIKKDPSIVFEAIKQNPEEFMAILQDAARKSQQAMAQKREKEEQKQLEDSFNNPLKPVVDKNERFKGVIDAPITIVEYSDFQCPFCKRGNETLEALFKKYPGKVKLVYKHLPLNFHPQAMISAHYFEAIASQSPQKAFQFHDELFSNQNKLKHGESFLRKLAKDLKVDIKKLDSDLKSPKIKEKVEKDMEEAAKFGFQGTPGFIVNGVPVKGAYPLEHFVSIIDKLQEKGKLQL